MAAAVARMVVEGAMEAEEGLVGRVAVTTLTISSSGSRCAGGAVVGVQGGLGGCGFAVVAA